MNNNQITLPLRNHVYPTNNGSKGKNDQEPDIT